jgi:hypothetical protein
MMWVSLLLLTSLFLLASLLMLLEAFEFIAAFAVALDSVALVAFIDVAISFHNYPQVLASLLFLTFPDIPINCLYCCQF